MSTPTAPVVRARHETAEGVTILACHGNICSEQTDAIVNAANERLEHGGGVAAAISTAGGPAIQAESAAWVKKHGPCTTGKVAAITSAGDLPCKKVVHVAGPIWSKPVGNELEVRFMSLHLLFPLPQRTCSLVRLVGPGCSAAEKHSLTKKGWPYAGSRGDRVMGWGQRCADGRRMRQRPFQLPPGISHRSQHAMPRLTSVSDSVGLHSGGGRQSPSLHLEETSEGTPIGLRTARCFVLTSVRCYQAPGGKTKGPPQPANKCNQPTRLVRYVRY